MKQRKTDSRQTATKRKENRSTGQSSGQSSGHSSGQSSGQSSRMISEMINLSAARRKQPYNHHITAV
jgi:hypothetical protein